MATMLSLRRKEYLEAGSIKMVPPIITAYNIIVSPFLIKCTSVFAL